MKTTKLPSGWENVRLGDEQFFIVNPPVQILPDKFYYIDLESVVSGKIVNPNIISKVDAPSRAQRVLCINDTLLQLVRPYQQNNYFFNRDFDLPAVASTGYAQIRTTQNPVFIYYTLHTDETLTSICKKCVGSNYPAINTTDLKELSMQGSTGSNSNVICMKT